MAGGDNTTVKSAVELEFMSKEDSSWQPCQVSLCPSGVGLDVYYGSNGIEDTLVREEEILAHLRVRSNPLQSDDCIHIKQGEHVLAAESSNSCFFDAEVEKVVKVRHSKKVQCRCSFVVKWLQGDSKEGTRVVPSSSIMKLAKESINGHPTISAFIHSLRTTSPLPIVGNDMESELDLHELLGKQIEEINLSADTSKKSIRDDFLLAFQVHTEGQIQRKPVAASITAKSQIQVTPNENHGRRSTRKSNRLQAETEVKDPPPPVPATQEDLPEHKSPVNPLAARAALASLMSKLPKNLEFSFNQEGEKLFSNTSDIISHKQVDLESLDATEYISSSVTNSFSLTAAFSSVAEKNISHPRKATRLISAAVKNVTDTSVDKTGNKQKPARQSRRFTRSAVHNEEEIKTVITDEAMIENISKSDATDTPDQTVMAWENYALEEKYEVAIRSSPDTETDPAASKAPKSLVTVGGRKKKNAIMTPVSEIKNTGRLTRSAMQKDIGNTSVGNSQGRVEHKVTENSDSSGGNVCPLATALSVHAEISITPTEERNKKRKTSGALKTTRETEGNVLSGDGNSQDLKVPKRKSTSTQKHEVRSSPRLRFLPRTRSQGNN